jgi:hypothetical protein
VGVPGLVDPAGDDRGVVLVQRRPFPFQLAGPLAALVPMSVKSYSSARSSPTPALNALASIMLVSSLLAVALGTLVYRRLTRGERGRESAVQELATQV